MSNSVISAMRWTQLMMILALVVPLSIPAAAEERRAREAVGKPVQAAEELLREEKYEAAQSELDKADAVAGKTPYETYIIAATRAGLALATGDNDGAIKALEAVLATGMLPAHEVPKHLETLVQLNYQAKNYAAVVADADRYYAEGGSDETPRLLVVQAYYVQGNFAKAAELARAELDGWRGQPPESLLQLLAASAYQLKDEAAYLEALERLVASYSKREYWRDVLAALPRKPGFAHRLDLDLDRLRLATGAMDKPGDYMEAAQRALVAGEAEEAKEILDRGFAGGILGQGAEAERQRRLAAMAQGEAAKKPSVAPATRIAELTKAIAAGAVRYPEDAKLHLGVLHWRAGEVEKARATFRSVHGSDGAEDLAKLWLVASGEGER